MNLTSASVFSPILGRTRCLKWARIGDFPSRRSVRLWRNPSRVGCGKTLSPEASPRKEEQNSETFFKVVAFPSLCWKHEMVFLWYKLWGSGRALGGKTHKSMGAPQSGSPRMFGLSDFCTLSLQQRVRYGLGFRTQHWVLPRFLLLWSCDSLYPFPQLGGSSLPCDLTCLTVLRRMVDFSVCFTFYSLGGSGDFSAFSVVERRTQSHPVLKTGLWMVLFSWTRCQQHELCGNPVVSSFIRAYKEGPHILPDKLPLTLL